MKKNAKHRTKDVVFNMFLFLVIFTSVNKLFKPFNLDLRYITVLLGGVLLWLDRKRILKNPIILFNNLIALYVASLLSVLFILRQFSVINVEVLMNLIVLHSSIMLYLIVFKLNQNLINKEMFFSFFTFSIIILLTSLFFVAFINQDISIIHGYDYNAWVPQKNFIGGEIRVGGFAQDPNYASLWILIYNVFLMYYQKNNNNINTVFIVIILFTSVGLYMIAASKTILLGSLISLVYLFIQKYLSQENRYSLLITLNKLLIYIFPLLLIISVSFFRDYLPFNSLDTMSTRYNMWKDATLLFTKNPILGSGLSSFRNYFEQQGNWYVQSHSTIFQLISEMGLIGLFLYLQQIEKWLAKKNVFFELIVLTVFFMSITNELLYLPYLMFVELLFLVMNEENFSESADVYIINHLSGGGAEKVVENLLRASLEEGVVPVSISFDDENDFSFSHEHYSIESGCENKVLAWIVSRIKYDYAIQTINLKYDILLITNHLPRTQFLALGQVLNYKASYIIHGSLNLISDKQIVKCSLGFLLYTGRKLGAVSLEILEEIEECFLFPLEKHFIFNPIDFREIDKKAQSTEFKPPFRDYILYIGRFDENKNPLYAINFFLENFQKNSNLCLVMLGTGELFESIRNYISDKELEKSVYTLGFVENPYPYIKNAEFVLSTSTSEAQPLVVIESLYLKTPVFGTNSGKWTTHLFEGKIEKYFTLEDQSKANIFINDELQVYELEEFTDYFYNFEPINVLSRYRKLLGVEKNDISHNSDV